MNIDKEIGVRRYEGIDFITTLGNADSDLREGN